MTKKQRVDRIEILTEEKILYFLENDETERLVELTPAINHLAKNNRVLEKERTTIEEGNKARLKRASERRAKNESK